MPFFGPSFAGRSNSTTGTLTLTRCAAICAPMTPAPSTATFFTLNRLMVFLSSLRADPCLRAIERAEVAAHLQFPAVFDRCQAHAVFAAVLGVEDLAAADDLQAQHRLVPAVVAAFDAFLVGLGVLLQDLLDPTVQAIGCFDD